MREVLFRGKRMDNGKWVYGSLLVGFQKSYICPEAIAMYNFNGTLCLGGFIEVSSESVGQYTGLMDKNGNRIFVGGMIKPFDDEVDKMVVEFHYGQFLLCLYGERGYMAEYGWEEEGNYGCLEAEPLSSYGDDIEVIGNIHDNQELLKGGASE